MSTTLIESHNETWQLEPHKNLVEGKPVKDSEKFSTNRKSLGSLQNMNWEDLRGLSALMKGEDEC